MAERPWRLWLRGAAWTALESAYGSEEAAVRAGLEKFPHCYAPLTGSEIGVGRKDGGPIKRLEEYQAG